MIKCWMIFLIMITVACKPVRSTSVQTKTIESVIGERPGESVVIQKNKDASFALCIRENPSTLSVTYTIVRLNDMTIVEQDTTSPASFSWIDNFKIEVKFIPGIVMKDEQSLPVKVIDVTKYNARL
jgi:hypothetical protein